MNILWFFAGISLLIVAQFVCFSLLLRFTLNKVYSDLAAWFVPAKEGELSQFGQVANAIVDNLAATFATKAKMSVLGEIGGKSPKSPRFTGNRFIDGLITAAAPSVIGKFMSNAGGTASGIPVANSNHGSQGTLNVP